jgi:tetratricopeptide (TPR) repeat protein
MMRRFLMIGFLLLAALAASLPLAAQQTPGFGRRSFLVGGTVRDAVTNQAPEGQLVELYVFDGSLVSQIFTTPDGAFDFGSQPADTYDVVVNRDGYERVDQQISLTRNTQDIMIELRRKGPDPNAPTGALVSLRELSIPRKAHDDMEKGRGLMQKPDYPASLVQFQRAVKEFPAYYEAYAQMGVAYQRMGDVKNAEQMLRKSVDVSKNTYPDAVCLLASLLNDQQKFADAAPLARKAIELDSTQWQGQFELARALYGLGDLPGAETSAAAAVDLHPDTAETYLVLANIHSHQREYPKLVDDLDHYLKLIPTGEQADQARQERDEIRQRLTHDPDEAPSPARTATP